ncbi:hypothetical protein BDP81DRAFT_439607 [Colletotrichum phormii]|uniref:Uncharacterized protein n=1 Tax=Colletotrichum phormii TaxID=359342 RepID=A0AAI9ZFU0_9PEZI|nr:uncharacterized protein BDP81DRAFT_439607 [Colletotrichum phormii]KAK1623458.1 hypothetical protein BDP81DRAFT_439607 [Colletotrichum phormii]
MRCPGPPYNLGPYCWVDDDGRKYHKLMTRYLTSLVAYVEDGRRLKSQAASVNCYMRRTSSVWTVRDGPRVKRNIHLLTLPMSCPDWMLLQGFRYLDTDPGRRLHLYPPIRRHD